MTDAPKIDTQAPERVWLKPCDPCNAPDDYYVCHPLFLDGREVSYVKDDLRCQGCGGGLKRVSSQIVCVECGKADDFAALMASRADLADARAAAAWIAGRDAALSDYIEWGELGCSPSRELVSNSIRALTPPTDPAALDRLIAERVREAVEAEREACAKVAKRGLLPCDIGGELICDPYTCHTIAANIRARGSKEGRDG